MSDLKRLLGTIGVSGYESKIGDYILSEAQNILGLDNCAKDNIGNVVCRYDKNCINKKKIIINAHMDEVGFQVYKFENERYRIKSLGNIRTWNAYNQYVLFENGSMGIIRANNQYKLLDYNFDNIYIDLLEGNIEIGDVCTFKEDFYEDEIRIICKAIDNRISCYVLLSIMNELKKNRVKIDSDLIFSFTVQEETTMRGMRVISSTIKPDILINIDTSPENDNSSVKLNNGIAIKYSDSIVITDRERTKILEDCAKKNNIKYQIEVSNCGTNELIISNEEDYGTSLIGISIPCRNLHTAKTEVYKSDYEYIEKLIIKFLEEI